MRVLPPAFPGSDIPSVTEIKQAIATDPGRCFFYAGSKDGMINTFTARQFLHERYKEYSANGYKLLDECFTLSDYHIRWAAQGGSTATAFWTAASVAFAEKAEGTVYVLLPSTVAVNSIWHFEQPILMDSTAVQNIIVLDIYNNKRALKGTLPLESPANNMTARFQGLNINMER